jgi:hypothetical protein
MNGAHIRAHYIFILVMCITHGYIIRAADLATELARTLRQKFTEANITASIHVINTSTMKSPTQNPSEEKKEKLYPIQTEQKDFHSLVETLKPAPKKERRESLVLLATFRKLDADVTCQAAGKYLSAPCGDMIKALLATGIKISDNATALYEDSLRTKNMGPFNALTGAASTHQSSMLLFLLEKCGGKEFINTRDSRGVTPLGSACLRMAGSDTELFKTFKILLDNGADPDLPFNATRVIPGATKMTAFEALEHHIVNKNCSKECGKDLQGIVQDAITKKHEQKKRDDEKRNEASARRKTKRKQISAQHADFKATLKSFMSLPSTAEPRAEHTYRLKKYHATLLDADIFTLMQLPATDLLTAQSIDSKTRSSLFKEKQDRKKIPPCPAAIPVKLPLPKAPLAIPIPPILSEPAVQAPLMCVDGKPQLASPAPSPSSMEYAQPVFYQDDYHYPYAFTATPVYYDYSTGQYYPCCSEYNPYLK